MQKNILILLFCAAIAGCSTKAFVVRPGSLTGKKIALSNIDLTRMQKGKMIQNDTVCACLGQAAAESIYPYLLKAGATVVMLTDEQRSSTQRMRKAADSLQVDYFLMGSGIASRTGKVDFMEQLNLKLVSLTTNEIIATGSFSGPGVTAAGAAKRIGEKIFKSSK
jgi:hypothetical protein